MQFIDLPNLPDKKTALCISAVNIDEATVISPCALNALPEGLRNHADLGICVVSAGKAVCPPDSYEYYNEKLSHYGFSIIKGETFLDSHYPKDSAYNVCIVGKKCFLNKNEK